MSLCDLCDAKVHKRKSRSNHKREPCREAADAGELELLSVLCMETSHYVCFTRDGEGRWLFFDSMANRVCEELRCLINIHDQIWPFPHTR